MGKVLLNILASLALIAAGYFLYPSINSPKNPTVKIEYIKDTVRVKQPYPVFLQGKDVPFEDTTKIDSLVRLCESSQDTVKALVKHLATPFQATYDDSMRHTVITAFPIEKLIKDSTLYKPIPVLLKQVTITEQVGPDFLDYVEIGAVGLVSGWLISQLSR